MRGMEIGWASEHSGGQDPTARLIPYLAKPRVAVRIPSSASTKHGRSRSEVESRQRYSQPTCPMSRFQ